MRIGIIGGGAAGMMAAVQLHKMNMKVQIFDANSEPGRKLNATGAGRCNISNLSANEKRYFSDDPLALQTCFRALTNAEVLDALVDMGIPTAASDDGWVYPLSYSAANVVNIFRNNLADVPIFHNILVSTLQKKDDGFLVAAEDQSKQYLFDKLLIACGSPANPQLGARDALYEPLKRVGHHILPVSPALTPIETDPGPFHKLQGVRLDAGITLRRNNKEVAHTLGNIIFTQWGLNGPGVMDLSHFIETAFIEEYTLQINFAPKHLEDIQRSLNNPNLQMLSPASMLAGFFPSKTAVFLLKKTGLDQLKTCAELTQKNKAALLHAIQQQEVAVRGVRGFKHAQASTGGVALADIDANVMESRVCPGLYFAGEILNVLGPCGGYNLHWAFLSGILAARGIYHSLKAD